MARFGLILGGLLALSLLAPGPASAVAVISVSQGNSEADLAAAYSSTDLLQGLIATELPGDRGWHPANPASGNSLDPNNGLPVFTDGQGPLSGVSGLLNDFPAAGAPAKRLQYTLGGPADVGEIHVFSGNNGRDGRVFHTYTVEFSSNGGATWSSPLYVQSHASGTLNNAGNNAWRNVMSLVYDPTGALATGVTDLRFDFYAVDNTAGQMRDPFDGVNPFTGVDDGLNAAFVSPLLWEIDVVAPGGGVIPEPSSLLLLGTGLGGLLPLLRRKRR